MNICCFHQWILKAALTYSKAEYGYAESPSGHTERRAESGRWQPAVQEARWQQTNKIHGHVAIHRLIEMG